MNRLLSALTLILLSAMLVGCGTVDNTLISVEAEIEVFEVYNTSDCKTSFSAWCVFRVVSPVEYEGKFINVIFYKMPPKNSPFRSVGTNYEFEIISSYFDPPITEEQEPDPTVLSAVSGQEATLRCIPSSDVELKKVSTE